MKRLIPLLFTVFVLLFAYPTLALAAEAEMGQPTPDVTKPLPPYPEDMTDDVTEDAAVLYPTDVQTVIEDGWRQIVKTYELGADVSPGDIPRKSFDRDGWRYELADITAVGATVTDTRAHVESVTIDTSTNDTNTILSQLAPTMEYTSDDGYTGVLTLNVASVKVEQAGTKTSSFNVSATREYPHLSACDTSLIPKTITDNGRTLTLADVDWRAGNYVNVDYEDLPEYYTAVATYTGTGSKTVVTGYVTTAEYTGTLEKVSPGKTVYTAIFAGSEVIPEVEEITEPAPEPFPVPDRDPEPEPTPGMDPMTLTGIAALCALLLGVGAGYLLPRKKKATQNKNKGEKTK